VIGPSLLVGRTFIPEGSEKVEGMVVSVHEATDRLPDREVVVRPRRRGRKEFHRVEIPQTEAEIEALSRREGFEIEWDRPVSSPQSKTR
jgi:hypothetical protein